MIELRRAEAPAAFRCTELPQVRVSPAELGLANTREGGAGQQYVNVSVAAFSQLAQMGSAPAVVLALAVILHDKLEGKPLRSSQQRAKAAGLTRGQFSRAVAHLHADYFVVSRAKGKPLSVGLTKEGRRLFHTPRRP